MVTANNSTMYKDSDKERPYEEERGDLPSESYRTCWRVDYARLIHSPAFRRLQGKTQLFPGSENDFFRNRLTHSIEVAQIAKSIAIRLNDEYLPEGVKINTDLVEFAGLAHDLGHPPFGHIGEKALDECMKTNGGFEGNAQTLRILARLEKKRKDPAAGSLGIVNGADGRHGLNLTYRSLASVLKYDEQIAKRRGECDSIQKGYYYMESNLVGKIKERVGNNPDHFKSVECQIMDLADDIAYSTYDLEDAFKAGFLQPMDLLSASEKTLEKVSKETNKALGEDISSDKINEVLFNITKSFIVTESDLVLPVAKDKSEDSENKKDTEAFVKQIEDALGEGKMEKSFQAFASNQYAESQAIRKNAYERTALTSRLVGTFIREITIDFDEGNPVFSKVRMEDEKRKWVEILKRFTYVSQVDSPRLRAVEYRGKEIVSKLFNILNSEKGYKMLPADYREMYEKAEDIRGERIICDFVAGMTNRYALEYYRRITSGDAQTIFKPY